MLSLSNYLNNFRDALERHLGPIDVELIPDGEIHRLPTHLDRPGQRSGWYVLFTGPVPAGAFGDWRSGLKETWSSATGSNIPLAQRQEIKQRAYQARLRKYTTQKTVAHRAVKLWQSASSADADHPYLRAKHVQPLVLRQRGSSLLVPITDGQKVVNLQLITPDGEKRFLRGGRVKGCYSLIMGPERRMYVCEGWATGATIHALTGATVACAMHANNLLPVALELRRNFPQLPLIVAGDNDRFTPGNPGKRAAEAVAKAVGARWVIPEFPERLPGTDFNDHYLLEQEGCL